MSSLETSMIKARGAEKRGDFEEAERLYSAVLLKFPGNARARKGMDELFKSRSLAMLQADAPPQAALDALADAYNQGQMALVVSQAEILLEDYPRSALVHNLAGAACLNLGQPERAEALLRAAHEGGVRHPAVYNNLGMALASQDRHAEAMEFYGEALALDPNYAIARNNLGNVLKERGDLISALENYSKAIVIQPHYADAYNNMGLVLDMLGRDADAELAFRNVLALQPNHAAACNNLGNLLSDRGDLNGALAQYEKAIQIDPDYTEAHYNLGNLYKRQGRVGDAQAAYARAVALRQHYPDALTEQGKTYALEGQLDAAIAAFNGALAIEPKHAGALAHRAFFQAHACDWSGFDAWPSFGETIDAEISPFAALTFEDDPASLLRRSRAWAARNFPQQAAPLPHPMPAADGRIRIGYFSADFHDHATLYLMSGLLREHDRARFEIHAFSYGRELDDEMRRHLVDHADTFHDVRDLSDAEVAALAHQCGLDIAVDLKGYTQNGRMRLFAQRLAPVQIGYLGYPGSSAADFIDYLVADAFVVPANERAHYSEKLIVLPHSYQPNDNQRPIADSTLTRADHGLPEGAFVFCSFNQSYKISPREFAVWMRLLDRVPGSVLWLLQSNPWAEAALRDHAKAHGIAPERLVFAPKLPHAEHLARHRHADLFLDSFNVNAHTTASDALWTGVPVVTLAGRQFAARVAGSLLHAVGLPELATDTVEAYEALALELATKPGKLVGVKLRLAANRAKQALFDTAGYTRDLEQGFAEAHRRNIEGQQPDEIVIN